MLSFKNFEDMVLLIFKESFEIHFRMMKIVVGLTLLCLAGLCQQGVKGVAVMSVDLGTEWMKVAIVSVRFNFYFGTNFLQHINRNLFIFSFVEPGIIFHIRA